jgi:hypothetical protein
VSKTLTLPDHLHSRLAAEARAAGLSSIEEWLQLFAAKLPGKATPTGRESVVKPATIGSSLDAFIGDWTETEADEFDRAVAVFDQIDESLWQ